MTKLEEKKIQCHCVNCGKSVWLYHYEIPNAYDVVCKECEQEYEDNLNKQLDEFLRKEEPYLYD